MKLRTVETGWTLDRQNRAVLAVDGDDSNLIVMQMPEARMIAGRIAHAVNMHDSMLSVLTVMGSKELGGRLIGMIETSGMPVDGIENFKCLINAVDVILKGNEISKRLVQADEHD